MRRILADTYFYIAWLSRRDRAHELAKMVLSSGGFTQIISTTGVILELAGAMSGVVERERCARLISQLQASKTTSIISLSEKLVERGLSLYASRLDKEWSLTDCISFVVMADERLTEALTGDKHFQQAGFKALLA